MNLMAKLSIITGVISLLIFLLWPSVETVKVGIALCGVFALASMVLGIIALKQIKKSKEKGKGLYIACIIVGVILILLEGLSLIGFIAMEDPSFNDTLYCTEVKDCIDYCKGGNDEGYNCTLCKLEKNSDGEWIVVPV
jgi:hypothetical protein